MKEYFTTFLGFFRLVAFLEGLSLLVLLCIAMPLKYIYDKPAMVQSVGGIHGFLFILFMYLAFRMAINYQWSFIKTALIMFSSFIPFGTFVADHKIFRKLEE